MKDNYNAFPSYTNPERIGTLQHEDYEMYVYEFYHNKDFHIKRLERGKNIKTRDKIKIALYSALTGILGVGAAIHGIDFIADFVNSSLISSNLIENVIAVILTAPVAYVAKDELIDSIRHLSRVKKDIAASESMVDKLSEEEKDNRRM